MEQVSRSQAIKKIGEAEDVVGTILFLASEDTEVIGYPAGRSFLVNCYRGGALVAVESVNRPADHVAARKFVDNFG